MLLMQFLFGMYVNLYVTVPQLNVRGGQGNMMAGMGQMMVLGMNPTLMAHMMLGMLLLLFAVVAVVAAALSGRRLVIALAAAGLASVLLAGYGGLSFVMFGQQNNASFTMAVGFVCAFTAYFAALIAVAG